MSCVSFSMAAFSTFMRGRTALSFFHCYNCRAWFSCSCCIKGSDAFMAETGSVKSIDSDKVAIRIGVLLFMFPYSSQNDRFSLLSLENMLLLLLKLSK